MKIAISFGSLPGVQPPNLRELLKILVFFRQSVSMTSANLTTFSLSSAFSIFDQWISFLSNHLHSVIVKLEALVTLYSLAELLLFDLVWVFYILIRYHSIGLLQFLLIFVYIILRQSRFKDSMLIHCRRSYSIPMCLSQHFFIIVPNLKYG